MYVEIVKTLIHDTADKINKSAKDVVYSMADGDEMRMMLMGVKRFTKYSGHNVKAARRQIAAYVLDKNEYSL